MTDAGDGQPYKDAVTILCRDSLRCQPQIVMSEDGILTLEWHKGNDGVVLLFPGDGSASIAFRGNGVGYGEGGLWVTIEEELPDAFHAMLRKVTSDGEQDAGDSPKDICEGFDADEDLCESLRKYATSPNWRSTKKPCRLVAARPNRLLEAAAEIERLRDLVEAYELAVADKRRLTRELDIAMHGENGAAKQASLCDLIEPARMLRNSARQDALEEAAAMAEKEVKRRFCGAHDAAERTAERIRALKEKI